MRFESFAASDPGLVRQVNEDTLLVREDEGLFLVADGMGGFSKGDVASRIAVETVEKFVTASRKQDITWPISPQKKYTMEENRILAAVSMANWNVYIEFLKNPNSSAMGTTLVGLLSDGERMVVTNVGDSRAYLIRENTIRQVTEDHSLVMEEVRKGTMTPEAARHHPQKHIINRALGISGAVQVDISSVAVQGGDLFLLCSDGLSDMLSDEEILDIAGPNMDKPLRKMGEGLVLAANEKGGKDNVTVVLVRLHDERAKS